MNIKPRVIEEDAKSQYKKTRWVNYVGLIMLGIIVIPLILLYVILLLFTEIFWN